MVCEIFNSAPIRRKKPISPWRKWLEYLSNQPRHPDNVTHQGSTISQPHMGICAWSDLKWKSPLVYSLYLVVICLKTCVDYNCLGKGSLIIINPSENGSVDRKKTIDLLQYKGHVKPVVSLFQSLCIIREVWIVKVFVLRVQPALDFDSSLDCASFFSESVPPSRRKCIF